MSFDLGIWYSDVPIRLEQALSFYQHINQDWVSVRRSPEIDAFLHDLLTRFPDGHYPKPPLQDPDEPPAALLMTFAELRASAEARDADEIAADVKAAAASACDSESPWASSPVSAKGAWVVLAIVGSKIATTVPVIIDLALRHELVLYDPQEARLYLPPSLEGRPVAPPDERLMILRIAGKVPMLHATLLLNGETIETREFSNRRDAHKAARELARAHWLDYYQVEDRASLM